MVSAKSQPAAKPQEDAAGRGEDVVIEDAGIEEEDEEEEEEEDEEAQGEGAAGEGPYGASAVLAECTCEAHIGPDRVQILTRPTPGPTR